MGDKITNSVGFNKVKGLAKSTDTKFASFIGFTGDMRLMETVKYVAHLKFEIVAYVNDNLLFVERGYDKHEYDYITVFEDFGNQIIKEMPGYSISCDSGILLIYPVYQNDKPNS